VFDGFAKCLELNTGKVDEGGGVPTSGLLLTLVAIHLCQHVTVYGQCNSLNSTPLSLLSFTYLMEIVQADH
jgi:hypothetical protein